MSTKGAESAVHQKHFVYGLYSLYLQALEDRSCFFTLPEATLLARKAKPLHTFCFHFNAVARLCWCHIVAIPDNGGMIEMLMQMIDIFQHGKLTGDTDIVDRAQVLSVLWQTDAA